MVLVIVGVFSSCFWGRSNPNQSQGEYPQVRIEGVELFVPLFNTLFTWYWKTLKTFQES